ncbi:MAG: MBL fold metallo-hydrolase [Lachnospiraceae bacterium]|nr:MBL fold metallo-hydrolase [Lachnospiraceae bacterium]
MIDYTLKKRVLGPVGTNCYVLANTETHESIIIDPADDVMAIQNLVEDMESVPVAILLTHGHFDHIMAVNGLKNLYSHAAVYIYEGEKDMLGNAMLNCSSSMLGQAYTTSADEFVRDGEVLGLAGFAIQVLHTPGHTEGSVCYYLKDYDMLFSGDTLFAESVGRTDLPTGSGRALQQSLRQLLEDLPDQVKVYPGHMDETTIEHEKRYNPFA